MFRRRAKALELRGERLSLRLPDMGDFSEWRTVRQDSTAFLAPWEPVRDADYLGRPAFRNRVYWARRGMEDGRSFAFLIFHAETRQLVGGITLDNVRRGPAMAGSIGYWMSQNHTRQGYMTEAVGLVVNYAFSHLGLSRIEAACLPENQASRAVLERSGFKYEGVAQSYLQIAGRWRNHVLYANLRRDRRGKTDAS
jgi:ribosomal-protein-alanine N-acetyltransferase